MWVHVYGNLLVHRDERLIAKYLEDKFRMLSWHTKLQTAFIGLIKFSHQWIVCENSFFF